MLTISNPTNSLVTTTNATSYSLDPFTPAGNCTLVVVVATANNVAAGTVSGGGLTWTNVVNYSPDATNSLNVFWANTGAAPGEITITYSCSPATAQGASVQCLQFAGSELTGSPIVQTKTAAAAATADPGVTFDGALNTKNGYILSAYTSTRNPFSVTPPSGWTEDTDSGIDTPTAGVTTAYRARGETGTAYAFTSAAADWMCVGIEVLAETTFERSLAETLGLRDTPLRSCNLFRALTDAVAFRDVQLYKPNYKTFDSEKLALRTNEVLRHVVFQRAIAETLGLSDATVQRTCLILRQLGETCAFRTSEPARVVDYYRQLGEVLGLTDVFADILHLRAAFEVAIAETLAFRDTNFQRTTNYFRQLSEAVAWSETISRACTYFRTITDYLGLSDTLTIEASGPGQTLRVFYYPRGVDAADALSSRAEITDELRGIVDVIDVLAGVAQEQVG